MAYTIDLSGKTTIITGACKGIGKEIARIYMKAGAQVVINDIIAEEKAWDIINKFDIEGLTPFYIKSDVSTREGIDNLIYESIRKFSRIDVLVNNAGVVADWDKSYELHVKGVYNLCESAKEHLVESQGKIIILTSASIFTGGTGIPQYVATKAGTYALILFLAREYARLGIRVNGIAPAVIMSDMLMTRFSTEEALIAHYEKIMPMGKVGYPEDIAGVALFLGSDLSRFLCGQVLIADGGRMSIG